MIQTLKGRYDIIFGHMKAIGTFGKPGPKVIKLFSFSTQLSRKFQQLIKAKIPTN